MRSSSYRAGPDSTCVGSEKAAVQTMGFPLVSVGSLRERSCEELSTEFISGPVCPPTSCNDTSSVEDSHRGARIFPDPAPDRTRESCEGFEGLRSRDRPVPNVRPRGGDCSSTRDDGGGVSVSRRSGGAREGGAAKNGVVNTIGASLASGDASAPTRCPLSAAAPALPAPGSPSPFLSR